LPTFAPFFHHHFFKTKYFFQKLKALERDKVVFHFYFFFSKCVGDYTVLLSSCIPKKSCTKSVIFFFILLSLFLGFKNEISFHILLFFSFINISSCKMICNSFFSLWEHPLMTSDIRVGRGVQDSPQNGRSLMLVAKEKLGKKSSPISVCPLYMVV